VTRPHLHPCCRPASRPDEVRQLNGLVDGVGERGIFVATDGFTGPAEKEDAQMKIQLWNLERLAELYIDIYDKLDDETRALVPLRRIWVLDDSESALRGDGQERRI
jgi:restriction system protein